MSNLFEMPGGATGEAAYNSMTLTTGVGQAQAWNNTPVLNGIAGDVTYTIANTNNTYATKDGLDLTTALATRVTGWVDGSGLVFSGNALFGICVLSLASTLSTAIRIGVAYSYTHATTTHALLFQKVDDGGGGGLNNTVVITPGPHKFDFRFQKATSAIANDGRSDYYVDDDLKASRTGLDIHDDFEDMAWLQIGPMGKISANDASVTGVLHIGKIGINDTGDPFEFSVSPFLTYLRRRRRD